MDGGNTETASRRNQQGEIAVQSRGQRTDTAAHRGNEEREKSGQWQQSSSRRRGGASVREPTGENSNPGQKPFFLAFKVDYHINRSYDNINYLCHIHVRYIKRTSCM